MTQLWKELHTNAIGNNRSNDAIFLSNFGRKIPRYTTGCSCREFWNNWVRQNPPIYTPAGAYFAWTVKAHNAVNAKLGKPQMSVEDAIAIWSPKIEPPISSEPIPPNNQEPTPRNNQEPIPPNNQEPIPPNNQEPI